MTIQEEIEKLDAELAAITDERLEAAHILAFMKRVASVGNLIYEAYITRLFELSQRWPDKEQEAWARYYLSILWRIHGRSEAALDMATQSLALFTQLHISIGIGNVNNSLGNICWELGKYPEALENFRRALHIKEEIADHQGMAVCYSNIGNIYARQANYPEAKKYYETSLGEYERVGSAHGIAFANNNIGVIHENQGNYAEALRHHMASLKYMEEIGDMRAIASSHNNIGTVYQKLSNYEEALDHHAKAIAIRIEVGDARGSAHSYGNLGNIHKERGEYNEALANFNAALALVEKIGDTRNLALSYAEIGDVYCRQGKYEEALKYFARSMEIAEPIGDQWGIASVHAQVGIVHFRQGHYPDALREQLTALRIADDIGRRDGVRMLELALVDTCRAMGDFESALLHYQKYHEIEKEVLGAEAQKQVTQLTFQHDMEIKDKELHFEKKERELTQTLLLNILPAEVAEELKIKGSAEAKSYDNVTVLFTDFVGFTTISERLTPQQLVDELHTCFSAFDGIIQHHGIEKIKTVGDAYLAISGLPLANPHHAQDMLRAAIDIRDFMQQRAIQVSPLGGDLEGAGTFQVRIGIHSGSVVAGIVGVRKFAYDIWGDTVNTAARMEQNSEAGKINISETTYQLVRDEFECQYRGEIEAKNKGMLKMYFVN